MAITLTKALNGSGVIQSAGNTYADRDDADAYFEGRLDAETWNTAGDERQEQSLLTAMRVLEALNYIGIPSTETQPLAWPRIANTPLERGLRTRNRVQTGYATLTGAAGGLYDKKNRLWVVTAIPTPVVNAQCEIALAMLTDQSWVDADTVPQAEFQAGSVRIKSGDSKRGRIPAAVGTLLAGLLKSGVELMRA